MSFADLGLSPDLLRTVAEEGYLEPTPIQQQAIPVVLAGRDVVATARRLIRELRQEAIDPELFAPQPVEPEHDVFFYGYGDKFRREWMRELVGEPSRRLPEARFALGGEDFRGDVGAARVLGPIPYNVFPRAISAARSASGPAPVTVAAPRSQAATRAFMLLAEISERLLSSVPSRSSATMRIGMQKNCNMAHRSAGGDFAE